MCIDKAFSLCIIYVCALLSGIHILVSCFCPLSGPLNRLNAILSLLHPLFLYPFPFLLVLVFSVLVLSFSLLPFFSVFCLHPPLNASSCLLRGGGYKKGCGKAMLAFLPTLFVSPQPRKLSFEGCTIHQTQPPLPDENQR